MHTRSVNKGALWSAVAAATAFGRGSRSYRGSAAAAAAAGKRQLRLPRSKTLARGGGSPHQCVTARRRGAAGNLARQTPRPWVKAYSDLPSGASAITSHSVTAFGIPSASVIQ